MIMKLRNIVLAALCLLATAANAQKELIVLTTNDTHSTIMPLSENLDDTLKAGRGGFLRRWAMIQEQRKQHPDLLLFDSGDFSQGSPYYTLFNGGVEVELMNAMKYDAVALGNHELDFGMDNLASLLKKARFPMVCANYEFVGTPLENEVKPYVILERGGVRIGVFGLSPNPEGIVAADNHEGIKYNDPIESAKNVVEELRNEANDCDVVICLSHLGWNMKSVVDDSTLIANTTGIDLVLGAHSHTYFTDLRYVKNVDGNDVPVDQNGKHGIYVGKLRLAIQNRE